MGPEAVTLVAMYSLHLQFLYNPVAAETRTMLQYKSYHYSLQRYSKWHGRNALSFVFVSFLWNATLWT